MSCTDENYKERYYKALETLRDWNYPCNNLNQLQAMKERVFPELKETVNDKETILKKFDEALLKRVEGAYYLGKNTDRNFDPEFRSDIRQNSEELIKIAGELFYYKEKENVGNNIEA